MQAIWTLGESSVHDVLVHLNHSDEHGRDLVYNTVMATMARLHDKGHLDRRRDGRAYRYRSDGAEAMLTDCLTRDVAARLSDHGQLTLLATTAALDDQNRARLVGMLAEDG